jgi:uncharacterized RDD family membrane protein YckC
MKWYYAEAGVQKGPVGDEEFGQLTTSGVITADTLVWRDGMAGWERWGKLSGPPPLVADVVSPEVTTPPEGARYCSSCGKPYAPAALVPIGDHLICGNCKPAFLQSLREGRQTLNSQQYGGFWIRFGARFIDGILLGIVTTIVQFLVAASVGTSLMNPGESDKNAGAVLAIFGLIYLIGIVFTLAYEIYFLTYHSATPGKMMLNLKVVRSDGSALNQSRSIGRAFAYLLSNMTVGIGFIIAGFDDQKRALHDHLADTRVIRTN